MTISRRSVVLFTASLIFGAAFPVAATYSVDKQGSVLQTQDGTTISLTRTYSLRDRYDYNRAILKYDVLRQQGVQGLIRPDINNRSSVEVYLEDGIVDTIQVEPIRTDPLSTTDYVKSPTDVTSTEELSQLERAELSRAQKVGRCYWFPSFSTSYMTLCRKMIQGRKQLNTRGLINDLYYYQIKQKAILYGSSSSPKPRSIFEGLKDNRSGPRTTGRAFSSSSSSSKSSSKVGY